MTCCIAVRYDEGILIGTDTLITAGETKLTLGEAKTFDWRGMRIAYSGPLHYIQMLQSMPEKGYVYGKPTSFQKLVWDYPADTTVPGEKKDEDDDERDDVEFLLVTDEDQSMYIISGWGDMVRVKDDYAVVGSDHGWVGMDLEYPRVRKTRNLDATKRMIAKVLRVVAHRDNTVAEPFCYEELVDLV